MENQSLSLTGQDTLSRIAQGELVALPPFLEGQPFVARLKKPSLLGLAAKGVIPNPLLSVAASLFNGKLAQAQPAQTGGEAFKETADMFHIIAENALAQPTMAELEAQGIGLTDMQYLAIFNYTQLGVKGLSSFRGIAPSDAAHPHEPALPGKAQ